jgi:hypothetical protein
LNFNKLVLGVLVGVCVRVVFAGQLREVSTGRHTGSTGSGPDTHRKIDLLNFSGSCVLAHGEDFIGIFWGMGRPRCMKEPLQEHMKGRPGNEG